MGLGGRAKGGYARKVVHWYAKGGALVQCARKVTVGCKMACASECASSTADGVVEPGVSPLPKLRGFAVLTYYFEVSLFEVRHTKSIYWLVDHVEEVGMQRALIKYLMTYEKAVFTLREGGRNKFTLSPIGDWGLEHCTSVHTGLT